MSATADRGWYKAVTNSKPESIAHVRANDVLVPFERTARDIFEMLAD